jgi:hypothetical protein
VYAVDVGELEVRACVEAVRQKPRFDARYEVGGTEAHGFEWANQADLKAATPYVPSSGRKMGRF